MTFSWRERLSEGRIIPHFQPILSVETGSIAAYEALGRHAVGPEIRSLGPFFESDFHDKDLSNLRREVDRTLRRLALTEFRDHAHRSQRLFLNVAPMMMLEHLNREPDELPWTLRLLKELGLDPGRVVIELTEEPIGAETYRLQEIIALYRRHGCAIAVDDVGAEASNLDRIGYFQPDIIKIDAAMLRRSLRERSFRQVLKGVGAMAEGIGATLLFEGVETEEELQRALELGARYLQGWFFGKASAEFLEPSAFTGRLKEPLGRFGERRLLHRESESHRLAAIVRTLGTPPDPQPVGDGTWILDRSDLVRWSGIACRVFLTDRTGFQVSANYEGHGHGWSLNPAGLGVCRSIRPYFPGGMEEWTVSEAYHDVNDRSQMRTFGRQVAGGLRLFVDVLEIETRAQTD